MRSCEILHRGNEGFEVLHFGVGRDAVAEVENVTVTTAHRLQQLRCFGFDLFGRRGHEAFGIEIALHCVVRQLLRGFGQIEFVANTDTVGADVSQRDPIVTTLRKNDRESFDLLLDKLSNAVADFLKFQIENGADAVQIFDTLGGILPTEEFEAASGRWMRKIVKALNRAAPTIVFAKGCHDWVTLRNIGSDAIGVGHEFNLADAAQQLPNLTVQGNFDPELLVTATQKQIESEATRLLTSMRGRNGYIFNLGHGVPPDTKMENLETLVATVKNFA